ncbi:7482_t:CDS:2, partial [Gigaspora margarita]
VCQEKLMPDADTTPIRNLFTRCDEIENEFRANIRAYNSIFSFISMGVKLDEKLANGSLIPNNNEIPKFIQLYIYDTEHETSNRLAIMPKLYQDTLETIKLILDQFNPFRTYNTPTASQVAAIWVEGHDPIGIIKRDIIVQSKSRGNHGWHPEIMQNVSQNEVTARQYYAYKNVRSLWNDNLTTMSEDFLKKGIPKGQLQINAVFLDIKSILEQHYRDLSEFDLPPLNLPEQNQKTLQTQSNLDNNFFKDFLLNIENGTEPVINSNMICIPDQMVIPWKNEESLQSLIKYAYQNINNNYSNTSYFTDRAIFTTKNEYTEHINKIVLNQIPDPANGLCNSTKLICQSFQPNVIEAIITTSSHKENNDQTIPRIGLYLPKHIFAHGQLYVAFSQSQNQYDIKVLVKIAISLECKEPSHIMLYIKKS